MAMVPGWSSEAETFDEERKHARNALNTSVAIGSFGRFAALLAANIEGEES